jgi:hypothetical protein
MVTIATDRSVRRKNAGKAVFGLLTSRVPERPFSLPLAFESPEITKIRARKATITLCVVFIVVEDTR